jgi:predicted S18 family serine protease
MDKNLLRMVCSQKLSEAEERLNYLELYYPDSSIRDELKTAYNYYTDDEYALCIFTASKIKADSDVVLSAIFVPENATEKLFDEKISAAKRTISKQERSNIFPILGYSYYEYAITLKDTDKYSSLLYAEYSLELSNLDMYFKKRDSLVLPAGPNITRRDSSIFTLGLSIGVLITILISLVIIRVKYGKVIKQANKMELKNKKKKS